MIEHYLLLLKEVKAPNSCGLLLTGLRFFLHPRGRRKTSCELPHAQKKLKASHHSHPEVGRNKSSTI
jgi:hypothetical protein